MNIIRFFKKSTIEVLEIKQTNDLLYDHVKPFSRNWYVLAGYYLLHAAYMMDWEEKNSN